MVSVEEILILFKSQADSSGAKNIKKDMDDVDKSAKNAGKSIDAFDNKMKSLKGALTGGAMLGGAAGLMTFYQQAVQAASSSEQNWGKFTVALGRTGLEIGQVKSEYSHLVTSVANDTGRLKGDVIAALGDLARVGVTNQEIMRQSADTIGALAFLTQSDFGSIEEAYTKIISKSNIQTRQLTNIGIRANVFDEVLKKHNMTMKDWANLTEEQRANLLNEAAAMQNAGAANEAYKNTYEGMMNQLTNAYKSFMTSVGNVLIPILKDIGSWAIPILQEMVNAFNGLPGPLKQIAVLGPLMVIGLMGLGGFVLVAKNTLGALREMGTELTDMPGKAKNAKDSLDGLDCVDPCDGGADVDGKDGKKKKTTKKKTSSSGGILSDVAGLFGVGGGSAGGAAAAGGTLATIGSIAGGLLVGGATGLLGGFGIQSLGNSQGWSQNKTDFAGSLLSNLPGLGGAVEAGKGGAGKGFNPLDAAASMLPGVMPMKAGISMGLQGAKDLFGIDVGLEIAKVGKELTELPGKAKNEISKFGSSIGSGISSAFNKGRDLTVQGIGYIAGYIGTLPGRAAQVLQGLYGAIGGMLQSAWDYGIGVVNSSINTVTGAFWGMVSSVDSAMKNMYDTIAGWTQAGVDMLRKLYCMVFGCSPGLIPAFKALSEKVPDYLGRTTPHLSSFSKSVKNLPDVKLSGNGGEGGRQVNQTITIDASHMTVDELMGLLIELYEGKLGRKTEVRGV